MIVFIRSVSLTHNSLCDREILHAIRPSFLPKGTYLGNMLNMNYT